MSNTTIIRFPTERTTRGKQDEAMRVFEEARAAWHTAQGYKCCDDLPDVIHSDEFTYDRAELMGLPKEVI